MKLFIIATVITITTAARLEHLQNTYLPPVPSYGSQNSIPFPTGPNQLNGNINENFRPFGSIRPNQPNGPSNLNLRPLDVIGPNQQNGILNTNSRPSGNVGVKQPNYAAYPSAPNQYLPPNVGSASGNAPLCCAGAPDGFGAPAYEAQPANSVNTLGQRYQLQSANKYLAQRAEPVQNYPQQSFDEQTGYHYK